MEKVTVTGAPVTKLPARRRRKFKLTGRDEKILRFLGEYGCVTADRIKQRFWNDNPRSRAHYRRIAILMRVGWIEGVSGDFGVRLGYRLTKHGRLRLQKEFPNLLPYAPVRRAYKSTLEHDQLLIDLRQIFTQSPLIKGFRSESKVRRDLLSGKERARSFARHPLLPDAMFVLDIPKQRMKVALELELTQKSKRRYARIFRSHLLSKHWDICIYIVKGEAFRQRLMRILGEVKATDLEMSLAKRIVGIYFGTLEEFQTHGLSAALTNGKKELSLAQLAKNFSITG